MAFYFHRDWLKTRLHVDLQPLALRGAAVLAASKMVRSRPVGPGLEPLPDRQLQLPELVVAAPHELQQQLVALAPEQHQLDQHAVVEQST